MGLSSLSNSLLTRLSDPVALFSHENNIIFWENIKIQILTLSVLRGSPNVLLQIVLPAVGHSQCYHLTSITVTEQNIKLPNNSAKTTFLWVQNDMTFCHFFILCQCFEANCLCRRIKANQEKSPTSVFHLFSADTALRPGRTTAQCIYNAAQINTQNYN